MKKKYILSSISSYQHVLMASLFFVCATCHDAHATPAHYISIPGDELDLSVPCATVKISVDPTLKTGASFDDLTKKALIIHKIQDGAEVRIHASLATCQHMQNLRLHLAPETTLTLHDSPQANINVTGTLATLESSLTDATLSLDHVQSLDLTARGNSNVHINQLDRIAIISIFDHARVHIDKAFLSTLSNYTNNNSRLIIEEGQIDTLSLISKEQSFASIMAQVGTASTTLQDNASLTIKHITGSLSQSGNGQLHQVDNKSPSISSSSSTPSTIQDPPPSSTDTTDGSAQGLDDSSVNMQHNLKKHLHNSH